MTRPNYKQFIIDTELRSKLASLASMVNGEWSMVNRESSIVNRQWNPTGFEEARERIGGCNFRRKVCNPLNDREDAFMR